MKYFDTLKTATAIDDHRVAVEFREGRKAVFDCAPYFRLIGSGDLWYPPALGNEVRQ